MTLRSQINADVAGVFLNTEDFGETFYYLPAGGTRREIVGVVCGERSEVMDTVAGDMVRHSLQVFVSRDATTGIDQPTVGDALWRESEGTNPAHAWSYSQQVEEQDSSDVAENSCVLLFVREVPYKHGGLPSQ